jgi:hypothetical protein
VRKVVSLAILVALLSAISPTAALASHDNTPHCEAGTTRATEEVSEHEQNPPPGKRFNNLNSLLSTNQIYCSSESGQPPQSFGNPFRP